MKFHKSPIFVALLLFAFYGILTYVFYIGIKKATNKPQKQYGIISGAVKGYSRERKDVDIPGGVNYGNIGSFERSKRDKTITELTGGFGGFG